MKMIEVDEELYRYIASHTQHIGESASDILRRMLNFNTDATISTEQTPSNTEQASVKYGALYLQQQLESGQLLAKKKAVDRFIALLSILYSIHPQQFAQAAESLQGRTRVYFAQDEQTLLNHGKHTKPKAVLDTPYWVITNTNSERKRSMIAHMMSTMQFTDELIANACNII